ncbi:MAG: type II toxin-antitoxin system VapC family toxin [Hydrococcus sp. C42_A2020_068]|nr:type II toxin-antitoxin system VapC family toxin [Hydrococcus sp. C42_A2020_068]
MKLGIRFYGDADLHRQALKIAQHYNIPATYDAHYLALAERLGIELWTVKAKPLSEHGPGFSRTLGHRVMDSRPTVI